MELLNSAVINWHDIQKGHEDIEPHGRYGKVF